MPGGRNGPEIFVHYEGSAQRRLIVRYPYQREEDLGFQFFEAADRLAETFRGEPRDDSILLPLMYLYRHSIELALKAAIRHAALLRRRNGQTDALVREQELHERLAKKHRHSLGALANELQLHLAALQIPDLPPETRKALTLLAEADPRGLTFRYSGQMPETQDHVDFYGLNDAMKETYTMAAVTLDVLQQYAEFQSDQFSDYDGEYYGEGDYL